LTPLLIRAANPGPLTGSGNNTWLIDGAEPALVDAGIGAAEHVTAIAAALGGRPLARVIVTHGHDDHASGVPALRARWPDLVACKWLDDGAEGWSRLADGDRLRAGDEMVTILHTPGHAEDHVCVWHEPSRALFAGDMVIAGTTVMIPHGRGGNLRAYLASLARLASLDPARIYPGHGPVIDRPVDLIEEYIAHRELRERQVLAGLAAGIADVDGLVAYIYPDLVPGLRPAAALTVASHLEKLREEGRFT
jgi:glyoxylase-like metal-dependent hydrolase (beta-lactamase superfamily II)